ILIETHAEQLGADGREMLQRMSHAAERMGELIDALLRLSKLSHAPLYRVDADLTAMAHEVAQSLREAEPQRRVEFHVTEGLHTLADRPLIRSVVDNLVRNAWKFSRERELARIEVGRIHRHGRTDFFVR